MQIGPLINEEGLTKALTHVADAWWSSLHGAQDRRRAIEELRKLKTELKALEERKDDLETVIKSTMASAERLHQSGTVLATWKTQSTSRVDLKRLRAELPEAAQVCTVESTVRRFLLKGGADE